MQGIKTQTTNPLNQLQGLTSQNPQHLAAAINSQIIGRSMAQIQNLQLNGMLYTEHINFIQSKMIKKSIMFTCFSTNSNAKWFKWTVHITIAAISTECYWFQSIQSA